MSTQTTIEWTDVTWNPVTGCSKLTQGCKHCYAERMANRLKAMGNPRYGLGFDINLHHDLIDAPRHWSRPRYVFVNSMSDLFHEEVPFEFIAAVFATMRECPQHQFQALTKRADRLAELAPRLPWPKNVWMGVSVEDERVVDRIDHLRSVPAAVRFLSCEPLIGPLSALNLEGIDWMIVGGESGPGARLIDPAWVVSLRDQAESAGVAFFFKQWGGVRKHTTGRLLEGREHNARPMPRLRQFSM